jgi:hypothetical protein
MAGSASEGAIRVRFVSCRNEAGARLAGRLLRRLGGGHVAADDETGDLDYAVVLCPPECDT